MRCDGKTVKKAMSKVHKLWLKEPPQWQDPRIKWIVIYLGTHSNTWHRLQCNTGRQHAIQSSVLSAQQSRVSTNPLFCPKWINLNCLRCPNWWPCIHFDRFYGGVVTAGNFWACVCGCNHSRKQAFKMEPTTPTFHLLCVEDMLVLRLAPNTFLMHQTSHHTLL